MVSWLFKWSRLEGVFTSLKADNATHWMFGSRCGHGAPVTLGLLT